MSGTKRYLAANVYKAAVARLRFLFDTFDRVTVSFSGGKDSTVLLDMARREALRRGRTVDVLFIDWEAQYQATIDHVTEAMAQPGINPVWVCLPISTSNETSVYDPMFTAWDPARRERWVRPLPDEPGVISDPAHFPFYRFGMTFEDFVSEYDAWYAAQGGLVASLVGIRADESMNRFRAIKRTRGRRNYQDAAGQVVAWSTQIAENSWNLYPLYDWRVEDIWAYIGRERIPYNHIYDRMWLAGMSLHEMRICEPYSLEARKHLDKYQVLEPATWARLVERVGGANLAAHQGRSVLFNYGRKARRPEGMSWKEYALVLLDALPVPLRAHYWRRIRVFVEWFEKYEGWADLEEESDPQLEAKKLGGSWRMVAHVLLKNDFFYTGLAFNINLGEYDQYMELVRKHEAGEPLDLPPTPAEARGRPITQLLNPAFKSRPERLSLRRPARNGLAEAQERWKDL
jgi:predicted phosphoadenosine phosphosulfate sulfurtransferase